MKDITITIQINKPVSDVFAFAINPKNTPLYVNSLIAEESNEWPVKIGTIYRNKRENSGWSEYKVTNFKENEIFEMFKKDGDFLVRYTFKPIDSNATKLKYYVRTNSDELDKAFIKSIVENLKNILEN